MPITIEINDCKTHRSEPMLETVQGVLIWCLDCDITDQSDTLYVSGRDIIKVAQDWNELNPQEAKNANNHK